MEVEHTYMSVDVTGVPTRKRANKKLKTRELDPSGATYSTILVRTIALDNPR